ncbi:MAG: fluoride efflux transporter CrcB [Acidobacteriota bacterium]|nr:fluoride efflux transporter CrcB [Acidobacteriota bacterium]
MPAEAFTRILSVAIGGACGALARYALNLLLAKTFSHFPFATFFINVTGAFLIGFLLVFFADKFTAAENLRLAVIVGFLGAYTTFSTFEMEIFELVREREFATAFLYLFSSVLIGFAGVAGGVWLAKRF